MSKSPEEIPDYKPGQPTRGHPSYKNRSIYVDPQKKPMTLPNGTKVNISTNDLVNEAMQEKLAGFRNTEFTDELRRRVGDKKAKKYISEMESRWNLPETGLKGFIKRRMR